MNINKDVIKNVINVDNSINNNSDINFIVSKNLFDKTTLVQRDMTDLVSENKRTTSRQRIYLKAGTYTFSTNLNTSIYSYSVSTCVSNPMPSNNYNSIYSSGYITNSSITFTLTAQQEGYFMLAIRKIDNSAYTLSDVSRFDYYLAKGSSATTESYITPTINVYGNDIYSKPKILWTNPNTSITADFTNQTINLSDNWETIFIVCRWKYGDTNEITIPVFKGNTKNFQLSGSEFSYDNTYGSGVRVLTRYCYYSLDDDKIISIGNCYGEDVFGSAAKSITNLQAHLVPLKIYKLY